MNNPMLLACAALLFAGSVLGEGLKDVSTFDVDSTLCRDDFEKTAVRSGNPKIVKGVVSNGLLSPTKQAVYATDGELSVRLPRERYRLPDAGSDRYFKIGFRLYEYSDAAEVSFRFSADGQTVRRRVVTRAKAAKLANSLPADVAFVVAPDGDCVCTVTSLVDGSVVRSGGKDPFFAALGTKEFAAGILLESVGGRAEMRIDEYETAIVRKSEASDALPPFAIDLSPTFDPKAAGWKLVFEDEFEGPAGATYDHDKWYFPCWRTHEDFLTLDGQGHLALKCDYEKGTTNLVSTGLWSKRSWRYGYFEARLKFTRNNGWWSAFWLYGQSNRNALECGSEIDIFEDYYTRYTSMNGPGLGVPLDHNLHVSYGHKGLKSYNCKSYVPGSIDEFHTIGCKWTPFEISIYADGKLLKTTSKETAYPTVSFDAFNHNAFRAPLHVVLSGCIFKSWGPRDTTGFTFPENFLVDSVRVWEYPQDGEPQVSWKQRPKGGILRDGTVLTFDVDVKGPVKTAYLFDNGACISYRTEAPWTFTVPFSKTYYEKTRFMKPGRQKKVPEWDETMHSYDVFVQDAEGRVSATDDRVRILPKPEGKSSPRDGQPQTVPGTIVPSRYDDGGRGVAYCSEGAKPLVDRKMVYQIHTGEWLSYTVDVAADGDYAATLSYTQCSSIFGHVDIIVDGTTLATVDCPPIPANVKGPVPAKSVKLPLTKGRHVLTLLPAGYLTFHGLDIR